MQNFIDNHNNISENLTELHYAKYNKNNQLRQFTYIQSNIFYLLKHLLNKNAHKIYSCFEIKETYYDYIQNNNYYVLKQYISCPNNKKWLSQNEMLYHERKYKKDIYKKYIYSKKRINYYDDIFQRIRFSSNDIKDISKEEFNYATKRIEYKVQRYKYQYIYKKFIYNLYQYYDYKNRSMYFDFKIQKFGKLENIQEHINIMKNIHQANLSEMKKIFNNQDEDNFNLNLLHAMFAIYYVLVLCAIFIAYFQEKI